MTPPFFRPLLAGLALLLGGCASPAPSAPRPPSLAEAAVRLTVQQNRSDGHRVVLIEPADARRVERILVRAIHFHEWSNQKVSADVDTEVWVSENGATRRERKDLTAFATLVDSPTLTGQLLISLHLRPDANYTIRIRGPVILDEAYKKRLNMLKLWELKGPVDFTLEEKRAPVRP